MRATSAEPVGDLGCYPTKKMEYQYYQKISAHTDEKNTVRRETIISPADVGLANAIGK